ncbi:MAG: hypothetical protein GY747_08775 [Planctomycetes bacterium]|nr:hypothetical protein [Planctomycetota bacterium]MCP4771280.1 hypothetical protein [Planctomycetota bacterium]MCP4861993.1 hypothetical protein [Planctomycetota bacterium]
MKRTLALISTFAFAAFGTGVAAQQYTIEDLGTLGGMESYGEALNNARHVVGKSHDTNGVMQAFSKPLNQPMVALPGIGGHFAIARDVNNFETIVGAANNSGGELRPVIWEQGVATQLPTLGGNAGQANALNDFGIVVGHAKDSNNQRKASHWQGSTVLNLNTAIASGSGWELMSANDINELGEICGTGFFQGLPRAFKLTPTRRPRGLLAFNQASLAK